MGSSHLLDFLLLLFSASSGIDCSAPELARERRNLSSPVRRSSAKGRPRVRATTVAGEGGCCSSFPPFLVTYEKMNSAPPPRSRTDMHGRGSLPSPSLLASSVVRADPSATALSRAEGFRVRRRSISFFPLRKGGCQGDVRISHQPRLSLSS